MLPAIDEFASNVSTRISQQGVVAHSETVFGVIAIRIPRINGGHGAGIWSDQRRNRKDMMAIVAATCYESRNQGMAQPWKEVFALAAVIQSSLAKDFRERIARRCAYGGDAEIGTEPLAISLRTLPPLG